MTAVAERPPVAVERPGAVIPGRTAPAWLRRVTATLAAVGLVYVALGATAFLTGGFDLAPAGVRLIVVSRKISAATVKARRASRVREFTVRFSVRG